ncbi:c-di-GMP-binding flagellar brake protein YcgR, contains PilZNR and PilZ domains [Tindallia magadiensis]|uniref:C-di-GMP-binding flagellar brake protein YcgR, contains PilZNR and PilZ domains n=1 Tax=Tindallia magadiensis TaxID=69895 RepID=A0A1I3AIH7_9FIRM|nr:PilZ domain-containing protein [Tindallia magadiensis]SFH49812.1 c-di-GMP-binding flagellar brake protein YcgR, contains PilZNR and PilZ domains [Tindallia magadiensis]
MSQLLTIGDKIDIEIENKRNPHDSKVLYSQVIEFSRSTIFIAVPMTKGLEYPLRIKQKINIIFYNDKGVFSFLAECVAKKKVDQLDVFEIYQLTEPQKKQRREYFRLRYMIKSTIKSLEKDTFSKGLTLDISGGGMKVLADKSFFIGEKVESTLFLEEESVSVASIIIRSHKRTENNQFELGIKFNDIGEQTRNSIIAFIFQKQGELRKKGLI